MTAATTETVIDPFLTEEFHTDPNAVIARSQQMLGRIIGEAVTLVFRPDEEPGRIDLDSHVGQHELNRLEVTDRLAVALGNSSSSPAAVRPT